MSEANSQIDQLRQDPLNAELVADLQTQLGQEWAAIYADPQQELDASAEIILRNPSVYLHSVSPRQLPEELQTRWAETLEFADLLADKAAVKPHQWGTPTNRVSGLEKLQSLVRDSEIKPEYRGSVADIMRNSSALFGESLKHARGDVKYYAGNVMGASSWLQNR